MTIIERASGVSMMTIKDGKCLVDGEQDWGSPCSKDGSMSIHSSISLFNFVISPGN